MSNVQAITGVKGFEGVIIMYLAQFSLSGLGPIIIMAFRKEKFNEYGIKSRMY